MHVGVRKGNGSAGGRRDQYAIPSELPAHVLLSFLCSSLENAPKSEIVRVFYIFEVHLLVKVLDPTLITIQIKPVNGQFFEKKSVENCYFKVGCTQGVVCIKCSTIRITLHCRSNWKTGTKRNKF